MTIDNAALRQFILQTLSDEELETLCFDYFPEVVAEFGSGMSQNRKAIALIGHCQRRGRLDDLHAALARERPEAWRQSFAAPVETFRRNVSTTTPARDPRQVFLSHATADAAFARRLADDLRAEGWRVWIAPDSIRAGEKWAEAIERGLEESGVFVVALTPDAVASHWVKTETNAAIELQHEGQIVFIPLDVLPSNPPRLWRQYQYITFQNSYEAGLNDLLVRLEDRPVEIFRRNLFTPPFRPELPLWQEQAIETLVQKVSTLLPGRRIHEKTGIELVRIPAGPYIYGSADMAFDNEKPQRTLDLPEYWIGRYPVTNAQFARFAQATGYKTTAEREGRGRGWTGQKWNEIKGADWRHPRGPKSSISGKDNHPVVQVSWDDAQAFCDWAGLALPTEEQWEKAARGTDGRIWPWGNEPPTAKHCNFNRNVGDPTPVGQYSPKGDSPYGCADLAGNVWEWTASWYTEKSTRSLRGGAWDNNVENSRAAFRNYSGPLDRYDVVGFRVVELPSDPES
jgi:formylglycine-generating enzyme required for sulfatase activity